MLARFKYRTGESRKAHAMLSVPCVENAQIGLLNAAHNRIEMQFLRARLTGGVARLEVEPSIHRLLWYVVT